LENYKTIKELADELGISKHIVKYQVDKLSSNLILKRNNRLYVSLEGQIKVKNVLNVSSNNSNKNEESFGEIEENADFKVFINEELFDEITQKNEQIKELHELLASQQKLLDQQQQQLTLQSNKQIEKLQNQLALLAPKMENEEEDGANEEPIAEDMSPIKEQPKKETPFKFDSVGPRKKWWQLWK